MDAFLCPPRGGQRLMVDAVTWDRVVEAYPPAGAGPGPGISPGQIPLLIAALRRERSADLRPLIDYLDQHGADGVSICFRRLIGS